MWRKGAVSLSVIAILLGGAGCGESSTGPKEEGSFAIGTGGSFVTTGGAEVTFIVDLFTNRMSFNAKGSPASGQFNFQGKVFGVGVHIHGEILCYSISGNRARVGGLITDSDDPLLVGQEAMWMVEDNGEGSAAVPDRVSVYTSGAEGTAQLYCTAVLGPLDTTYPIETGNVQVHF